MRLFTAAQTRPAVTEDISSRALKMAALTTRRLEARRLIEVKDNWLAYSQTYSDPCRADNQLARRHSPTS